MYQFFVEPGQINVPDRCVTIMGDDVNHIKNVLRMRPGEEIAVRAGEDGREYRCGILSLEEARIVCELRFIKEDAVELPAKVYLFQGLPKADKMELIIQKAVELGAFEITPVVTRRTVVKLDKNKEAAKLARWNAIAESAAKQSGRSLIPQVTRVMSFEEALGYGKDFQVRLIPYEHAEGMAETKRQLESIGPGMDVGIYIGPEGGFEDREIEAAKGQGVEPVSLGKRILRTETAGLMVLSVAGYLLESKGI